MCDNAMTYNRPDTVYYKLAKKILHAGFKMMSKVRNSVAAASYGKQGLCPPSLMPEGILTVNTCSIHPPPSWCCPLCFRVDVPGRPLCS